MRTAQEVADLRSVVARRVKEQIAIGAPDHPSTLLEQHAFEMGRLSVLKWIEQGATMGPE